MVIVKKTIKNALVQTRHSWLDIILKTYKDEECDADGYTTSIERERPRIQKLYPTRKVFGSYNCPDMDALEYSFQGKMDATGERALIDTFIAVYQEKHPLKPTNF